jgi:hypothetical protein
MPKPPRKTTKRVVAQRAPNVPQCYHNAAAKSKGARCEAEGTVYRRLQWYCHTHAPTVVVAPNCGHINIVRISGQLPCCSWCGGTDPHNEGIVP